MKTGYRRKVDGRNGTNEHRRVAKASQHSNRTVLIGGQSYQIGSRKLTRADLSLLRQMQKELQAEVNAQEASGLLDDTYVAFFDGR